MTYVPVTDPGPAGRKPIDVPTALLIQLRQSYRTGCRWTVRLAEGDDPAELDELRRALIRAGYRHFPTRTVWKSLRPDSITYWMTDKRGTTT